VADLSGVSTEDLLAALHQGDASPLAAVPTADLVAALKQSEVSTAPNLGESVYQLGKDIVGGAAGLADLPSKLFSALGTKLGMDPIPTTTFGQDVNDASSWIANKLGATPNAEGDIVVGPAADIVKAGAEMAAVPVGGVAANALAGAAGEVGAKAFPDNPWAPLLASLAPAATVGLVRTVANATTGAGRALERYSIGATKGDQLRALRNEGIGAKAMEGAQGKLSTAIARSGDRGDLGLLRTDTSLTKNVGGALDKTGKEIEAMAAAADRAGIQPTLAFPNTEAFIADSGINRGKVLDAFAEIVGEPRTKWDGSVAGLHRISQTIRKAAFSGPMGEQSAAEVAKGLKRAIGRDLQTAVKGAVEQTGISKATIGDVFSHYSDLARIEPIVERNLVGGQTGTIFNTLRNFQKTTGGFGAPIIAGFASGNPLLATLGSGYALGLGAATTPVGSGLMGSLFKGAGKVGEAALLGQTVRSLLPGAGTTAAMSLFKDRSAAAPAAAIPLAAAATTEPSLSEEDMLLLNSLVEPPVKEDPMKKAKTSKEQISSNPLDNIIQEVATANDIDPALLRAVAMQESNLNPKAKSAKGARGLTQLMPATARAQAVKAGLTKYDIFDPKTNLTLGAQYLKELLDLFGGDIELALTAYHSGPGLVQQALRGSEGSSLADIMDSLGPVGKIYAESVLNKMRS
jgi:hypothetical protein